MKERSLFLLFVLVVTLVFAAACSDDEDEEIHGNTLCNSNIDCTRDSYCDLDNPQQDNDLETLVYYCKKRQLCSTQADCPMNWKCKESEGFCITNKEAEGVMCRSNDDCKDPGYPICNLANGECEPVNGSENGDSGYEGADEDDTDTETGDDTDASDEKIGDAFLTEDFEAEEPNWTIVPASEGAPCWEIGTPTVGPAEAHGGKRVAATIIGGDYPDNCNDLLKYSDTVKIPSNGEPEISFYAWVDIIGIASSPYYDYVEVLVKKDGEMWETTTGLYLLAETPSPTSALDNSGTKITKELGTAYYKFTGDLSAYKGQNVEIGFRFVSDSSDHKDGFYLDDITLSY